MRRLGPRTRKTVLLVHILAAGAWIGIDIVMAVFIFTALSTDDTATKAFCFQALDEFAVWPLLISGTVSLLTGILLGLGTRYGLVKYWWVAIKLVLNLILTGLVLVALAPEIALKAGQTRDVLAGRGGELSVGDLIFPPIVSPAALLIAYALAVFKPWGRIRRRTATVDRTEPAAVADSVR